MINQLETEVILNVESGDSIPTRLSAQFETHNDTFEARRPSSEHPTDIAVPSTEHGPLERLDVDLLHDFLDHAPGESDTLGVADGEYEQFLRHLKEATFRSNDKRKMLYSTREIEDRAHRVGTGAIHAGFQRCSLMADQQTVYTQLARTGLDVHVYGMPDVTPPDLGDAEIHTSHSDEIAETWFVVFDSGGNDAQKTAFVAEETQDGQFTGIWTYDPTIVDHILEYLRATYVADETRTRQQS